MSTELDDSDESHRRDCLARHLLKSWSFEDICNWLNEKKHSHPFREDMRGRLNRIKKENRK